MSIISTITIAALSISGTITNNVIEKKSYNFLDPLGYIEYNLANPSDLYSYNDHIASSISSNMVSSGSNVHVLTHGMNGSADHWLVKLENGNYLRTDYSLPFVLSASNERIDDLGHEIDEQDLFIYKFNYPDSGQSLWKLVPATEQDQYHFVERTYIDEDAIDGQIVLIYEGPMGDNYNYLSNYEAYEMFASRLNTILTEIGCLQDGYIPSINLIGHSRGGIVNLLYSYHYPEVVNNLISLGTPYLGSTYANLLVHLYKNILGDENYVGYDDLLNQEHFGEYINYISEINSYINSYAIGFSFTPDFLFNTLADYLDLYELIYNFFCDNFSYVFDEDQRDMIATSIINGISSILSGNNSRNSEVLNSNNFSNDFIENILDPLNDVLDLVEDLWDLVSQFFSILRNDFDSNEFNTYVKSDICVDLLSQLGWVTEEGNVWESYVFDFRSTILFSSDDEDIIDAHHCANKDLPWVPHNFETKHPAAIENIIDYLNIHDGFHVHNYDTFVSTSTHEIKCLCGIVKHEQENHSYVFQLNNNATHLKRCSFEPCSYTIIEEHNFEYEYINFNYHSQICTECNHPLLSNHLINVYVFDNFLTHTSYCACGLVGETSEHTVSPFTGRCTYCGMALTVPEIPPIIFI